MRICNQQEHHDACGWIAAVDDRRYSEVFHINQNTYFKANCVILGAKAARTWPNWLELRFVLILPGLKEFVRLYASARNSRLWRSFIWNIRDRATSNCHVVGSLIMPRPELPSVPMAGGANAAGFRYWLMGRPDLSR